MVAVQKNFSYFQYVDDNGSNWSVRGEKGGALTAVDGNAPFDEADPVWGAQTKRRHVRYVEYQDPTTFRTVRGIVYTPTAFGAIARGDIVAVYVPGLATTVNYTVKAKIAEKQPFAGAARNLADHA